MRVLIVDDHREIRSSLRRCLRSLSDLVFLEADSVDTALAAAEASPDLMLLDIRLSEDPSDRGGLTVLRELRKCGRELPTIVVSGSTALDDVREAMRLGARDWVLKDEISADTLVPRVATFRERHELVTEVQRLNAQLDREWGVDAILGSSAAAEALRKAVRRAAGTSAPVLISGDSGTGKDLVARAIHQTSVRRTAPFVAVKCAALPVEMCESLLFGHESGAFQGAERRRGRLAAAGAGTLVLDEVAALPSSVQARLVRALEESKFLPVGADVELPLRARIVATSTHDPATLVVEGTLRRDLFDWLNVVAIRIPRLGDRGGDLEELLLAFAEEQPRPIRFTPAAVEWLLARPWPGNVRELRNVVHRLSIACERDTIDVRDLEHHVAIAPTRTTVEEPIRALLAMPDDGRSRYRSIERAMIGQALEMTAGNKSAAAKLLGIGRKALARRWESLTRAEVEGEDDDASD